MHILTGGNVATIRTMLHGCVGVAMLMLTACEQTIDVELPYQERIVVNGFVGMEEATWGIPPTVQITRTLPPLDQTDTARMRIDDVEAVITHRGADYPLAKGSHTLMRLPVESSQWAGDSVTLRVRGGGMTAFSTTYIPKRPEIVSATILDSTTSWGETIRGIQINVRAEAGSCVFATSTDAPFSPYGNYPMSLWQVPVVVPGQRGSGTTDIVLGIPLRYRFDSGDSVQVTIYAMDGVYERYRSSYAPGGGPFSSGGANPLFNVTGDAIGMFVGVSFRTTTVGIP